MTHDEPQVAGLLLAAGGGRRLGGRPKALLEHRGRPLVEHAVGVLRAAGRPRAHGGPGAPAGGVLRAAGCTRVYVVLGAAAEAVRERAELGDCVLVENQQWADGMGSSLR